MYLILQPGKVASQTIESSIRSTNETAEVERHHFLSDKMVAEIDHVCGLESSNQPAAYASMIASLRNQMLAAQKARDKIANSDQAVFVLTGFRDPLDFAISAFFQNITLFCPELSFDLHSVEEEAEQVARVFHQEFERFLKRRKYGLRPQSLTEFSLNYKFENQAEWLDRELLGVLGVDAFNALVGASPITRFCQGRYTVLLYRFESLGQSLGELLRQLSLSGEPVIRYQNIGSTKIYGPLYAFFRQHFVPSDSMAEYYYGGRYFQHFYRGFPRLYSSPSHVFSRSTLTRFRRS